MGSCIQSDNDILKSLENEKEVLQNQKDSLIKLNAKMDSSLFSLDNHLSKVTNIKNDINKGLIWLRSENDDNNNKRLNCNWCGYQITGSPVYYNSKCEPTSFKIAGIPHCSNKCAVEACKNEN